MKSKKVRLLAIFVFTGVTLIAGMWPNASHAAPFNLSENPSGLGSLPALFSDLPQSLDGLSTPFPVDVGTNSIIGGFGCFGFGCGGQPTNQKDVFRIEVPVGLQLSSIILGTSNVHVFQVAPTGESDLFFGAVFSSGLTLTPGFNLPSGTLGAGIYDLSVAKLSGAGWRFDFEAELATTVVPIPAALPLFLSALAGMGFFGWRKRQG